MTLRNFRNLTATGHQGMMSQMPWGLASQPFPGTRPRPTGYLDIFEKPYGAPPDPRSPKTPPATNPKDPSFPWSFRKDQGKPQKHQGIFSACEPLKTLENKQKTLKKTKEFRSKKNTKETKTPRKRRTGNPKDPSVLKIVRRANALRREKTLRQWQNATDSAQKCLFF